MHEMSLAEGIIELVEDAARREGARRVGLVVVEIGQLAAVEPEALRFCFAAVARGSVVEAAVLDIVDVPGTGCCPDCAATVALSERWAVCPACGGGLVQATGGTGMRVREIGIE